MNPLSSKVLESVHQVNALNVAAAPAQAMSLTFDSMAATIAAHMQNAVLNQKSAQPVTNAIVSVTCALIITLSSKKSG